jgi:hypothetical protein
MQFPQISDLKLCQRCGARDELRIGIYEDTLEIGEVPKNQKLICTKTDRGKTRKTGRNFTVMTIFI